MHVLEFRQVSKKFKQVVIAQEMNLQIRDGSFSVIFGAPGVGKSTLLRLITGLDQPDKGEIFLRGENMAKVSAADRNIGYVPQSFALYPHYSVFDNIAYPLHLMGVRKADYRPVVEQVAAQLQITHLLTKKPDQCSGGEKQRVAIARGIVKNTKLFILDDPLTGLDFKLRERLFDDLRQMREDLGATFIYTTSDPLETLILAEDIHVLDSGKIIESGPTENLYQGAGHVRTMQLLGFPNTNVVPGSIELTQLGQAECQSKLLRFSLETGGTEVRAGEVQIAVRPQHIQVNPAQTVGLLTAPAEITLVEDLGGDLHVYLEVDDIPLEALIPNADISALTEGRATIGIQPRHIRVYAAQTGQYIGQGAA
jgi:ABC-type sugar transport system ATPase subunit